MSTEDLALTGFPDSPELSALAAAGAVQPPSEAVLASALSVVRAAAAREAEPAAAPVAVLGPVKSRPRLRRWVISVAGVAAVAAAAAILPVVDFGTGPAAGASAESFLNGVAAKNGTPTLGGAQWWRVSASVVRPGFGSYPLDLYLSRNSMRRVSGQRPGVPIAWTPNGPGVTWDELATLPTDDTKALRAKVTAGKRFSDGMVFDRVADLLGNSPASPQLRGALYRVLATLPGVKLLGPGKDAEGRVGTGVSIDDPRYQLRWKLLIDPRTGRLLEKEQVTLRYMPPGPCLTDMGPKVCLPALKAGEDVARTTYLSAGPVAKLPPMK